jgi:two-component sensor histidine kinase
MAWGAVGVGCRFAAQPLLGQEIPFVLFFPPIAAAAIFSGLVSGFTCLLVCGYVALIWFLPPFGRVAATPRGWFAIGLYAMSGALVLWLVEALKRAIAERERAREQERLMLAELQHRVKNTLAVVQSIAAQSFRSGADLAAARSVFTDRLVALAEAHNILSEASWASASISELLERTLRPFVGETAGRFAIAGDDVLVSADQAIALALCFHELATNATKHGALSNGTGRVDVSWRTLPGEPSRVAVEWRERDGPPVAPPGRLGFGARLLQRGLPERSRPAVDIDYAPEGLRWRAEFDLGRA